MLVIRKAVMVCALITFSIGAQITKQASSEQDATGLTSKKKSTETFVLSDEASTAVEIPSGVLYGSFTKTDGPFLIKGNIIVPAGQKLELGPGLKILVGGKYTTITVFGELVAKGTPKEPVVIQSARKNPKPWDWDRIYCRSRTRAHFEHCLIRHSNYGILIENGSATIKECTFEKNSLHGLVVKNSDALVVNSLFQWGHVCAILCQAGADVRADSIVIRNNSTGIACDGKSFFKIEKGKVLGNNVGIAVRKEASVSAVAVDFTKNSTGIATEQEISKRLREMVYGNTIDMKLVTPKEMDRILKPPETVKSLALPKAQATIRTGNNFKPGFSALKAPRESYTSFIGNVKTGLGFYYPESHVHPHDMDTLVDTTTGDTTVSRARYKQTKFLGEHSGKPIDGLQPELILFAQGKRGLLDVNINADIYGNSWLNNPKYVRAELFTMSINYAEQSFVIGDFYETISETSISSRKMRGIKLTGNFWDMGRGTKRIEFKLAAGETEKKKDVGDHEVEIFSDTVDTGFSIRQQLTYLANASIKPTHNSTISFRGIISHDQDEKSIFSDEITDTAVPDPVIAATGCIDANVVLLDGRMEIDAELDMGAHDTLQGDEVADIAWYKPDVLPALQRVFGVIRPDSSNYAFSLGVEGTLKGYDFKASYLEIAENYFSAGNPYLEPDRRIIRAGSQRQFSSKTMAEVNYKYERTSASYSYDTDNETPTNNNTISLSGEHSLGDYKPSLSAQLALRYQDKTDQGSYVGDTTTEYDTYEYKRLDNSFRLEVKQRFKNGIDYSLKYRLVNKNDFSSSNNTLLDSTIADEDDSWENNVTARFGFRIKRILRNKITVNVKYKTEVDEDAKKLNIKVSDNLRWNIIPRKLTLILSGEYRHQNEDNSSKPYTIELRQKSVQADIKYAITNRLSAIVMGKYEDYSDGNEGSRENYTAKIAGFHMTYLF